MEQMQITYSRNQRNFLGKEKAKQKGGQGWKTYQIPEPDEGAMEEVADRLVIHFQEVSDLVVGKALVIPQMNDFLLTGGQLF